MPTPENKEIKVEATTAAPTAPSTPTASTAPQNDYRNRGNSRSGGPGGSRGGNSGGQRRGPRSFADRPKPEFDQKMLDIRRVTRVVAGGRRMSFAVTMVIGDKKGSVGVGTGKAVDTALAIGKALKSARKHMFKVKMTKELSIPHEVSGKFTSSKITMMPNRGKGLVAGSAARSILVLAGITNVTAKFHSGSKNKLNNARATMVALAQVATPRTQSPMESMQSERDTRIRS